MEYENGPTALHWFNYAGLVASCQNRMEQGGGMPSPKSELEHNKIATMIFNWLDCPKLAQVETVDCPPD